MSTMWRPYLHIGSRGNYKSTQCVRGGTIAVRTVGQLRMTLNTAWKSSLLIVSSMDQTELLFFCLGYLSTCSCTSPCCIYYSIIFGFGDTENQGQCRSLVMCIAWMYLPDPYWCGGVQGFVPYWASSDLVCCRASVLQPCTDTHIYLHLKHIRAAQMLTLHITQTQLLSSPPIIANQLIVVDWFSLYIMLQIK